MSNVAKSGIMHQIKEKLFHGDKHVDADWDAVFHKFTILNEAMMRIRASSNNYVSSTFGMFQNSNNVSIDFAALFEDNAQANPYQPLSQQYRAAHQRLNSDKQQLVANELTDKVIRPVDEMLRSFMPLQERINKRNELHANLEYYLNKVHELNKERDERSSKGKSETSKNTEKYDRNQQKLNTARMEYSTFASTLITDLNQMWTQRVALLGPALTAFISAEKRLIDIYGQELSDVNGQQLTAPVDQHVVQASPAAPGQPADLAAGQSQLSAVAAQQSINAPQGGMYGASISSTAPPPMEPMPSKESDVYGQQKQSQSPEQQAPHAAPVGDLNKSELLRQQGEEEGKRQRYEEEHKVMGETF